MDQKENDYYVEVPENSNGVRHEHTAKPVKTRRRNRFLIGALIVSLLINGQLLAREVDRRYTYSYEYEYDYDYDYDYTYAEAVEEYGHALEMDTLINMASYLKSSELKELCLYADGLSTEAVAQLASYMKSGDLKDVCVHMIDNGLFEYELAERLASYMKSEDLKDVLLYAVENGYYVETSYEVEDYETNSGEEVTVSISTDGLTIRARN